jgi:uridine kinase
VTVDVVTAIAAEVMRREPISGIRIVGIDGRSGSGKSVLAAGLSTRLGAPIIEIDDFVSWDSFADWWPRFDAQVLMPLLSGQDATFQARNWADWYGSSLGEWKTQPWAPTIIVEGVTCTRRATIGRIVYAAWVEAPAEIRLARGLARDSNFPGKEQLWERWMAEEDTFFAADATRDRADVVVDTARVETIEQQAVGDGATPPTPGASA